MDNSDRQRVNDELRACYERLDAIKQSAGARGIEFLVRFAQAFLSVASELITAPPEDRVAKEMTFNTASGHQAILLDEDSDRLEILDMVGKAITVLKMARYFVGEHQDLAEELHSVIEKLGRIISVLRRAN